MKCSHCGETGQTFPYTLSGGVHTSLCDACVSNWDHELELEKRAWWDRVRAKALAFCDPPIRCSETKPANKPSSYHGGCFDPDRPQLGMRGDTDITNGEEA